MLQLGERAENPVDSLVGFDAADGEQSQLAGDRADAKGLGRGKAAHADDVRIDAEVLAALRAQVFAGDDRIAAAAQAVGDGSIRNGQPGAGLERPGRRVAEEGRRVVHQVVEPAHACQRGVERGLISGEQNLWGGCGA